MAVTVTKAKTMCFDDTIMVTGTMVARNEIQIRPDGDGFIVRDILVEPGKSVAAGETLARLQSPNDQQGTTVAIRAPLRGLIVDGPSVEGTMTSAKGEPLFRLVADGALDLSAQIPASLVARISVGKPAQVRVLGLDDQLPGRVRHVSTIIDAATQLGDVRIGIGANDLVRIGTFARAIVTLGKTCGIAIPLSALLFNHDKPIIKVVRDGRIQLRDGIEFNLFAGQNVQIRQGLAEGELVVVRAGAFVRGNDQVRPVLTEQR